MSGDTPEWACVRAWDVLYPRSTDTARSVKLREVRSEEARLNIARYIAEHDTDRKPDKAGLVEAAIRATTLSALFTIPQRGRAKNIRASSQPSRTKTMTSDLIKRLEAATGPDRELDAEIALAVAYENCIPCDFFGIKSRTGEHLDLPAYTSSIDAALTLVPEGCLWGIRSLWWDGPHSVDGPQVYRGSVDTYTERDGLHWVSNELSLAAHPAIAIVIASLKAIKDTGQQ